ncbi:hypothetical protein J437_LFUL008088 [Ladona fulva]|uniref:Uncharacterized protein n=1 Tax=Ladona fulva TaxID=123851 RepID=A0A8K0P2T7_LADFU|nr:hypothetical protein J437_LFUL008088 [Ladona fulva]
MKVSLLVLLVAAAVLLAECVPVPSPLGTEQLAPLDISAEDGVHTVKRRSDSSKTLEDALNIPIAALEAVKRMLMNRFGTKNPDAGSKSN